MAGSGIFEDGNFFFGVFQSDNEVGECFNYGNFHFGSFYTADDSVLATTEAADTASFTATAVPFITFAFGVTEGADAANFVVGPVTLLAFDILEGADAASFTATVISDLSFNVLEDADTGLFNIAGFNDFTLQGIEEADVAYFKSFVTEVKLFDTDYIHVDREKYLLLVPPSDNVIYVDDENQYTAPVRTRLLRKELI